VNKFCFKGGNKMKAITNIHHISAIVGGPQETVDFYRDVLNLRFIKQTVNYDDEHTYHLYFSNQSVDNGSIITFFNWKNAHHGRVGSGQVGTIAFRIPKGSTSYWRDRLTQFGVPIKETRLFNQPTLELLDVHDLALALVESNEFFETPEILGFHGAILLSANPKATAHTLTQDLGLIIAGSSTNYDYFYTKGDARHQIGIPKQPLSKGRWGIGTVHHIAWAVSDEKEQTQWHDYLSQQHYGVTEIKNRNYFQAIYFQEPGSVVFEVATEGPGFTIDESFETLGQRLMLPAHFESRRKEISASLPKLNI
jgi:glyoxalase family protein